MNIDDLNMSPEPRMARDCEVQERRTGCRLRLQLPILIENGNAEWIDGETKDVSTGGFLLFASESLPVGVAIEYIVAFPEFRSVKLRCSGTILRSAHLTSGGAELAVSIDRCSSLGGEL